MTQSATPVWVEMAILFALVLVWFYLVTSLFRRLRTDHHAKFVEMGEPSLFVNNSPRTSFLLLRFLFRREDKELRPSPYKAHKDNARLLLYLRAAISRSICDYICIGELALNGS